MQDRLDSLTENCLRGLTDGLGKMADDSRLRWLPTGQVPTLGNWFRAAGYDTHYDGKWLLRTSDLTLTPADLAAAYKQLLAVERGWRDCKSSLGLRPVYHHREDRIRAHVQLCWLALLLIRVAETATGETWRTLRHELDRMHLVTLATADGRVAQRSTTTSDQKTILAALDLPEPPKYLDFTPIDAPAAD